MCLLRTKKAHNKRVTVIIWPKRVLSRGDIPVQ